MSGFAGTAFLHALPWTGGAVAAVGAGAFAVARAAEHWPGVLTIPAPLIMTYLLTFGSGQRNLERIMSQRPGYREYMQRTSGFFPWPPKPGPR
jgi:steroid 5-alpha reductase family enzyme